MQNAIVPAPLLLDPNLSASAKLLWMVLHLRGEVPPGQAVPEEGPPIISHALLEVTAGLAAATVRKGLSQLQATGWLSGTPTTDGLQATLSGTPTTDGLQATLSGAPTPHGQASVPLDLLVDRRLGIREKVLYGTLQLTPRFRRSTGQFTYAALCYLAGMSPNTVKQAVWTLQQTGWLQFAQWNKFSPIHFTLRDPGAERRDGAVADVARRLEECSFRGEALMREYLSVIVDSDNYQDNASPGFLINPYTGENMQFDRYYPPNVAFEYNGPQHDGPTARYPSAVKADQQRARDYMKLGICMTRGIRLVVVHAKDLTLAVMRQKADGLLPPRALDLAEPVIAYLDRASRAYRRQARKSAAKS